MTQTHQSATQSPESTGHVQNDRPFIITLCEPECPVEAIYSEDEIPPGQEKFLELNAELSQEWPVITEMKDPPEDADEWREVKDKLQYLER